MALLLLAATVPVRLVALIVSVDWWGAMALKLP
jgi:hypothetical protein